MLKPPTSLVGVLAASIFIALPVRAQLRVVVESSGAPVAEATVELWTSTTRVGRRVADQEGRVAFLANEIRSASTLLVRRVGYAPGRMSIDALVPEIHVELERLAAPLAEVTVKEAEQACPARDDPAARALWDAARRRYLVPDTRRRVSWFEYSAGTVRGVELGMVNRVGLFRGWRGRANVVGEDRKIATRGHAWLLVGNHTSEDLGIWDYPSLQHFHAEHFAEELFGAKQTLSFLKGPQELTATVLVFCARDRKQSGIDGTLRLGADSSFLDARWRFWNPARDAEKAGGEVVFTPFDIRSATPWLLSAQGLFWRQLRGGMYRQRWEAYEGWELWPDDSTRANTARRAPELH